MLYSKSARTILLVLLMSMMTFNVRSQIIQEDKALHFGVGAYIGAGSTLVIYEITKNKKKAIVYGIGLSMLAGITKEVIDHNNGGRADAADIFATTLGGSVGSISITINLDKGKIKKRKKKHNAPTVVLY